jgi:rsbT antagonist protein RsbS
MTSIGEGLAQEPLRVSILRQGDCLIASVHTALDDGQLVRFRNDLLERIGRERARGVIIDVAALDVIDSFACHTLRTVAQVARMRGAQTVVVGIQADVALAMVSLGATLDSLITALDLEEGLARLNGGAGHTRLPPTANLR